ncbi:formyl-CoA transferase [Mycoplana sp. BE70]|uniref:CaiB/BaiF CoA transferase family protein n=1 Tax=Mycoplana sp. BE70 TaxID=2817775 RepID=UPI0028580B2D|nr:CoA transferase [Mycoplana sp. BE70]MDR6756427.1 formyl-CoA transferase [Mycoplana sp. BE70]
MSDDLSNPGPASDTGARHYPLAGITVLDLSHIYNGPYATFLMAMAGAEIIKIEPHTGEHLRVRAGIGGAALPFAMLNGNKKSVTLDLKSEKGRDLLLRMVRDVDVLVENFAPGVTERLGIGPAQLQKANPRLIYASSTGYGRSGPYRDYPAMDITVQAMSGIMSITGFPDGPPVKSGPALCDFFAGIHLYGGIMTALYEREVTGKGRLVEVSMQESVYASLCSNLALYHANGGKAPARTGNRHGGLAESPYNVYPAKDGYIAIICNNNRHFHALLDAMKREELRDDPRFTDLRTRVAHMEEIDRLVGDWTAQRTKAELVALFLAHRVPHAPVRDLDEVVLDPHMHERRSLQWIDHPDFGRIVVQNSPIRYEGLAPLPLVPSSRLGEQNESVFVDRFGLDRDEFEALRQEGVI